MGDRQNAQAVTEFQMGLRSVTGVAIIAGLRKKRSAHIYAGLWYEAHQSRDGLRIQFTEP